MRLLVIWSFLDLFYNIYTLRGGQLRNLPAHTDVARFVYKTSYQTSHFICATYSRSPCAEVINYWKFEILANKVLFTTLEWINKIQWSGLRIIIEHLKRCMGINGGLLLLYRFSLENLSKLYISIMIPAPNLPEPKPHCSTTKKKCFFN